ncbi:hypothetical protein [Tissierella carlieri]|nr:hypothetical protein [Tissierella carlieri]
MREVIKNKFVDSLYPSYLVEKFDLTIMESLEICVTLKNEGLVLPMYEVRCPRCSKVLYRSQKLRNIKDIGNCGSCNKNNVDLPVLSFVLQ